MAADPRDDDRSSDRPRGARRPSRPDRESGASRPGRDSGTGRPARDAAKGRPGRDSGTGRPGRDSGTGRPGGDAAKGGSGRDAAKGRPARDEGDRRGRGGRGDDKPGRAGRGPTDRPFSRRREDRADAGDRTQDQANYDGPWIPEDISGDELDKTVLAQLKSLPEKLAARVARHLVAAARLMDSEPETAYLHTLAARARAARVPIVREASGEAAYAAGRFKDALAEFKAARRMSGHPGYLPMMADCERALGRPERALALAKEPAVLDLDDAGQIEMRIVAAGARRDLGDIDAAIRSLEGRELRSRSRAPWVARIRYAYADLLAAAGRPDEAREWFERAAAVDAGGHTDAAERIAELEGLLVIDTAEDAEADGREHEAGNEDGRRSTAQE